MNKEQIYSNISMLTNQLIGSGMSPEMAAKKAEATVKQILEASQRLAKFAVEPEE